MLTDVLITLLGGGLAGFAGVWFALRWWTRRQNRRALSNRPPKGTRPELHLTIDGVCYDLTNSLERRADRADGVVVWVVHGPAHLRIDPKKGLPMLCPLNEPLTTEVRMMVIEEPGTGLGRFATAEEIDEAHGPYLPQ